MKTIARRVVLGSIVLPMAASLFYPRRVLSASKSAVLVAPPGTLGPDLEGVAGLAVCAARAGSTGDILMRQLRALVINMSLSARVDALERGRCQAAIFVGTDKSAEQLIEEIKVFYPALAEYDFHVVPTE